MWICCVRNLTNKGSIYTDFCSWSCYFKWQFIFWQETINIIYTIIKEVKLLMKDKAWPVQGSIFVPLFQLKVPPRLGGPPICPGPCAHAYPAYPDATPLVCVCVCVCWHLVFTGLGFSEVNNNCSQDKIDVFRQTGDMIVASELTVINPTKIQTMPPWEFHPRNYSPRQHTVTNNGRHRLQYKITKDFILEETIK